MKDKVGILASTGLIGSAAVFDLLQILVLFIPIFDVIGDFFIGMTEIIFYGISFVILEVEVDPLTGFIVGVTEPIPVIGELPLLTPGVWNIIRIANKKHREKMRNQGAEE